MEFRELRTRNKFLGSDHELLMAKFRFKVGEVCRGMTRPFRYDLNQIPHDYTVEVRNRFKGLDLNGLVVFPTFFNLSLNLVIRSS